MLSTIEMFSTPLLAFCVIFLAEIGDKSQLVCMTLASKHKSKPIIIGAALAFALLNLLAVVFGGSLSHVIPQEWLTLAAGALFVGFGLQSLFSKEDDDEDEEKMPTSSKSIALTTFMMIFLAELGDKTQLAVVTMSTTYDPAMIWVSATLALLLTSVLGVFAGRKLLSKLNPELLHRISGVFFIGIGVLMVI